MSLTLERAAVIQAVAANAPGAGTEFAPMLTVPANQAYKLETLFFTLATSAVVANRFVQVQILDGSSNVVWQGGNTAGFAASGTYRLSWARLGFNTVQNGAGQPLQYFLPDVWLPAGYTVVTSTVGKDVGDAYSAMHGLIRAGTSPA